ncbi:hypothetical protein AXG93_4343s1540 [Marchantia polymorpha subsp. ruderalis]|uniref:Uncharacterized protein n=1 Tax=Marchantia polymorpha subsp. ruderalis TaxID=1480154 RepID=A0A176VUA4_MARPO|nr:hypothetical protein AXG93_4343s1540 [Marchantia polymorpha subsp. ruderalis]
MRWCWHCWDPLDLNNPETILASGTAKAGDMEFFDARRLATSSVAGMNRVTMSHSWRNWMPGRFPDLEAWSHRLRLKASNFATPLQYRVWAWTGAKLPSTPQRNAPPCPAPGEPQDAWRACTNATAPLPWRDEGARIPREGICHGLETIRGDDATSEDWLSGAAPAVAAAATASKSGRTAAVSDARETFSCGAELRFSAMDGRSTKASDVTCRERPTFCRPFMLVDVAHRVVRARASSQASPHTSSTPDTDREREREERGRAHHVRGAKAVSTLRGSYRIF